MKQDMPAPAGSAQGRWLGLLAVGVVMTLLAWWALQAEAPAAGPPSDLPPAASPTGRVAPSTLSRHPEPLAAGVSSLHSVRTRLFVKGSLAGTDLAGGWCVGPGPEGTEVLQPCPDLHRRFDHYLLGTGEVTAMELRSLLLDDARRAHGEALAGEIVSVWDRYLLLAAHAWRSRFDPADPGTWNAAVAEQRQVRRQMLGEAWAHAFFADEERHLEAVLAQVESGAVPPADPGAPVPQGGLGTDAAAVMAERAALYGEAAARRLAQVDSEWADWENRLEAARSEWQRLQQANQLSDLQRHTEMAQYLRAQVPGSEHARVKALLHLPDF